jgi:glucose/arabinose dehydrogenase
MPANKLLVPRLLLLAALCAGLPAIGEEIIPSEAGPLKLETVTTGLKVPWAFSFLPDGTALVGERDVGRLHRLNVRDGSRVPVVGLPPMLTDGAISSGLFDVRPHPDFVSNHWVYLAYGVGTPEACGLAVDRMTLDGTVLRDGVRLFTASPQIEAKWHFGGRLVFSDGYLFVSTGDGYLHSQLAQDLGSHQGKVLRLHEDGRIPKDNPFVDRPGALPEIWSYGVRNPQGMAVHPVTGEVWIIEHGPQGGDEVNIVRAGNNYGWPVITHGEEYGGGPIGDGIQRHVGMEQPLYFWTPSIAPSGMAFYTGTAVPRWQGSIFTGALALKHINRIEIEGEWVLHEERLLEDKGWRVRFVVEGPKGRLYFGVDDGMIMRLSPAE